MECLGLNIGNNFNGRDIDIYSANVEY